MSSASRQHHRSALIAGFALCAICVLTAAAPLPATADTPQATVIGTIPVTGADDLAVSPNGRTLYVLDEHAGVVQVLDAQTGTTSGSISVVGNLGGHLVHLLGHDVLIGGIDLGKQPGNVVLSPDGKRLYVDNQYSSDGSHGDKIVVVDTASAKVVSAFTVSPLPSELAINPNGKFAYALNFVTCGVDTIDLSSAAPGIVKSTTLGPAPCSVAEMVVSPTGRRGYVSIGDGGIIQLDLTTFAPTVIKTIQATKPSHLAISQDTHTLYATVNAALGGVSVINVDSGKLLATIDTGPLHSIVTTRDPALGFGTVPATNGTVTALDLKHNRVLYTIPVGSAPTTLALSPAGDRLYVANVFSSSVTVIGVPSESQGTGSSAGTSPATTGATPASTPNGQPFESTPALALSPLVLGLIALVVLLLVGLIIVVVILRRRRAT